MKLTISNIKLAGEPVKSLDALVEYLNGRLADGNIKASLKKNKETIEILPSVDKKLFLAAKKNYIPLKTGDARIKELGRDYLESERLSERQYKHLEATFSKYLDQIGISCLIQLFEFADDPNSFVVIRDESCNNYLTKWPQPSSFPLERN